MNVIGRDRHWSISPSCKSSTIFSPFRVDSSQKGGSSHQTLLMSILQFNSIQGQDIKDQEQMEIEKALEDLGVSPIKNPRDSLGYDFMSADEPSEERVTMVDIVKGNLPSHDNQDSTPNEKKRPAQSPPKQEQPQEKRNKAKKGTDRQHEDQPNCGCHDCIYSEAVVKGEPKGPQETLTPAFVSCMIVQKRLHKPTPLHTHSAKCLCIAHLKQNQHGHITMKGAMKYPTPMQTKKVERTPIIPSPL